MIANYYTAFSRARCVEVNEERPIFSAAKKIAPSL